MKLLQHSESTIPTYTPKQKVESKNRENIEHVHVQKFYETFEDDQLSGTRDQNQQMQTRVKNIRTSPWKFLVRTSSGNRL